MSDSTVTDYDGHDDASKKGVQRTTVLTQSKNDGLRNELSFTMRNSTWTISGWKACALETVSVGLMVAGLVLVGMHGREVASSVGSVVTGVIKRS